MSDAYQVFLPGETLPASALQDLGEQRAYTPALQASSSNPTLGSGSTSTGDILLHAGFVTLGWMIQFGTSGTAAGSGTYRITLPTGLGLDPAWQDNRAIGQVFLNDASGGFRAFIARTSSSNPDTIIFCNPADGASVTNSSPWTWAASDYLSGSVTYKTDFT